jgi:hypothetical protein
MITGNVDMAALLLLGYISGFITGLWWHGNMSKPKK